MEYIKLFWEGAPEGEPPVILYEVDTEHERLAIPTVEEFNAHVWGEEFHACLIEKTEFAAVWESHTHNGALKQSGGI